MGLFYSRKISVVLVVVILFNSFIFGFFGSQNVKAGFWEDHQGSIMTVIKGLVMLWIINLMRENATDNGNDDLLTSTIKKGLNLDENNTTNNTTEGGERGALGVTEEKIGLTAEELEMVELINQTRLEQGLAPLEIDDNLVRIARKKARDLVENDYLEHYSPTYGSPFDMLKDEGIDYSLAGENLAGAWSVQEAFEALMESPEHRDNILNARYDRIGVGIIDNGLVGLKIVELFIDSPDPTV